MLSRNYAIDTTKSMTPRGDDDYLCSEVNQVLNKTVLSTGVTTLYSQVVRLESEERHIFNGWNISNYHARLARGDLLPFTPWGKYEYTAATDGRIDIIVGTPPGLRYFTVSPRYTPYDSWKLDISSVLAHQPRESLNYLCTDAMAKIYGNGFDLLTNIAEFKNVVKLFKSFAKRLADFILYLPYYWRKMSFKEILKVGNDVNNEWLSHRYGWRIIVYDMLNLHKAFVELENARSRFSERAGYTTRTSYDESWETDHTYYKMTHLVHGEVEVSCRGSVVSDIVYPHFQFNPIQTAWEMITLSFVVDWVFNVGNTIQGLTYAFRPGNYHAATGIRTEVTQVYNAFISYKASNFISGDRWQSGGAHAVHYKRQPCEISMIPHLSLHLNSLKIVDLLALLVQRVHG